MFRQKNKRGYIYIASNKGMPGLVKIGMTSKNPRDRLKELYTTGVPYPFHLLYEQRVKDPRHAEKLLHHKLASCRMSRQREFFQIEANNAIKIAERTLASIHTVQSGHRWLRWFVLLVTGATIWFLLGQIEDPKALLEVFK